MNTLHSLVGIYWFLTNRRSPALQGSAVCAVFSSSSRPTVHVASPSAPPSPFQPRLGPGSLPLFTVYTTCTACSRLPPAPFYRRTTSLIDFLPVTNLNESVPIDLTATTAASRWSTGRCPGCADGKALFMVLHRGFNLKLCFSIAAMNYLNYAFSNIFQILSDAFL